ncbi:MAG: 1-phosphofructokinase family hexose kinase [Clostridiales bacterium]|mgnify:CR=1 FL=1|nr:1-phosphofructokinase family hexose kinase [Clostridiales bacterium]
MIAAVCLNPSIDRTVTMERFVRGGTNRALGVRDDAGGKGINVSAALAAMGAPAECICLLRREGAGLIERGLLGGGVALSAVRGDGAVRVNLKLLDRSEGLVTEVNQPGQPVSAAELDQLARLILSRAAECDYLALCGSAPPGTPQTFYRDLIAAAPAGCRMALDADGEQLSQGVRARPHLIKPNRAELERLAGGRLATLRDVARAAQSLNEAGVGLVVVSLGADGALASDGRRLLYAPALRVPVRSTVGAGDAMLAGLILGLSRGLSTEGAFRLGMGCAASGVTGEGTQPPDPDRAAQYAREVRLEAM